MEKVSNKWLTNAGFSYDNYPKDEVDYPYRTIENREVWRIITGYKKNFKIARLEHVFSRTINMRNNKVKSKSNWYSLYCSGNNFTVDNKITYKKFTTDEIENALKVVGLK